MINQEKPLISVVVPVYKVESYLDTCVKSILNQSYQNLEIILVDDGSPDSCPALCDEWQKKDSRIKAIHKKNGGLSDARNVGIDASSGDFLAFVDSDDYISPVMYEKLLRVAQETNSDIVTSNLCYVSGKKKTYGHINLPTFPMTFDPDEMLEIELGHCLVESAEFVTSCNKLFRRRVFFTKDRIRYPVGRLYEDAYTTYRLYYASRRTTVINESFYFYVMRDSSITHTFTPKNAWDKMGFATSYIEWAEKSAPHLYPLMEKAATNVYLFILERCVNDTSLDPEGRVRAKIKEYLDQLVKKVSSSPYASNKDKLRYFLYRMNLYIIACRTKYLLRMVKHKVQSKI